MEEKELLEKLKSAKLKSFETKNHKIGLKHALMNVGNKKESFLIKLVHKYSVITAVALVFAFTAVTFYVVDNMDDGDKLNKKGGIWSTFSDRHQGGDSVIWPPEHYDAKDGFIMSSPGFGNTGWAVRVTGKPGVNLGAGYNYMGVVVRFDAKSSCPSCEGSDIKKYAGIRFRVKGNLKGGELHFILPHESNKCIAERMTCESITDYADYGIDISNSFKEEWTSIVINFRSDLKQPIWTQRKYRADIEEVLKNVHLFKWQYKNGNGQAIDIWIDDVELF